MPRPLPYVKLYSHFALKWLFLEFVESTFLCLLQALLLNKVKKLHNKSKKIFCTFLFRVHPNINEIFGVAP